MTRSGVMNWNYNLNVCAYPALTVLNRISDFFHPITPIGLQCTLIRIHAIPPN